MGLETVELVMSWEMAFSISISNDLAATLVTPEIAINAIERIFVEEGRTFARSKIEEIIRTTTLEISGIRESDYRCDGRFVQDFGLD